MLFDKLLSYLRKVRDWLVAKPKIIELEQGTIIFRNVPKEVSGPIAELIKNYLTKSVVEVPMVNSDNTTSTSNFILTPIMGPSYQVEVTPVSEITMTDLALGVTKDNAGNYHLVEVVYNKDSREAQVLSSRDCGKDKYIAFGDFKMKSAKSILNY